jgi:hypothetical protein
VDTLGALLTRLSDFLLTLVPASSHAAGGANTTIAATAPVSPATGDLWLNTTAIAGTNDRPLSVWSGSAWVSVAMAHYDGTGQIRDFVTQSDGALLIEHKTAAGAVACWAIWDDGGCDLHGVTNILAATGLTIGTGANGALNLATGTGTVNLSGVLVGIGMSTSAITSGALPTQQFVSGTGARLLTTRDVEAVTPVTFNPGAATTATCTVALSPDNVTYSTVGIETEPAGVALDGTVHLVKVTVPAAWYLKLTVNAQATLGLTTYY